MADVSIDFNQAYFNTILRSAGVESLCREKAAAALAVAQANAPVKTGAYRRGLRVVRAERKYRTAWLVEGTDPKTLLVESRTGNLARALKAVRGK
jgi:hypothetical protein